MDKERRRNLHAVLVELLGSENVYFQPPESTKINYPCIIYSRDGMSSDYADNIWYRNKTRYSVTVIDRDPDSDINERLRGLKYCSHNRHYTADGLHHDVYTLYY